MVQKAGDGIMGAPSVNDKYHLHIGIPTYGKPDAMFAVDSLAALTYHIGRRHPEIETVSLQRDVRTYRQEARQAIVLGAQHGQATHLLMLDDDHTFSGQHFSMLWEVMLKDPSKVQMASALYFTRGELCAPCIFKLTSQGTVPIYYYPKNSLIQVDVVGFGFCLFDMKLFEEINQPWFNLSIGFGEDAAFCARMIGFGKRPWVHTGCTIGHILETPKVVGEEHYEHVRKSMEIGQVVPSELPRTIGKPDVGVLPGNLGPRPWWRPTSTHTWNEGCSSIQATTRGFGCVESNRTETEEEKTEAREAAPVQTPT